MKLLFVAAAATLVLSAKEPAPEWARDAARMQSKAEYPAKVNAVTLFHEVQLTVNPDGRRLIRERGAIRMLHPSASEVSAAQAYNPKTGRIRDFHGWMLLPSGAEVELAKNRVADVAFTDGGTVYEEIRVKVLQADANAPPGSVFAYEVTDAEDSIFTTFEHDFQESDPVLVSRFILLLPAGWEGRGVLFNHADVQPQISGSTYTWEMRDLPWIEKEEHSPGYHAIVPRLGVTYFPSAGTNPALRPSKDWSAVSEWHTTFADSATALSDAIRSKTAELTRSAATELDKIRAIAAFVQQTIYVSIQTNLTRGGGYTPHTADQVLQRNYGDCKDKTALMRTLLKAAGINSYAIAIYSGDRRYVRPEWASEWQFNHEIVAVRVSPETQLPTVIDHAPLGRLLIFDPTDPYTPVGDLPEDEQGSYAMIMAGTQGGLAKMPLLPAAANRIERRVDATLASEAQLNAHIQTKYFGQSASMMRWLTKSEGNDQFKRYLERSFSRRLGGVTLDKIAATDQPDRTHLELAVDVHVSQFGQAMRDRMLIVEPGALAPLQNYALPNKERKLPVQLSAATYRDNVAIKLPPGFSADEIPDAVDINSSYGHYRARWQVEGGDLRFEQSLEMNDVLAPASEYPQVRQFFEKVFAGQNGAVVLLKK